MNKRLLILVRMAYVALSIYLGSVFGLIVFSRKSIIGGRESLDSFIGFFTSSTLIDCYVLSIASPLFWLVWGIIFTVGFLFIFKNARLWTLIFPFFGAALIVYGTYCMLYYV
jgi:hypothetical protein